MQDSVTLSPIGVFDSGVGGLSVLKELKTLLPAESFIYVADSGHAPYGDRESGFVEARAREVARFLCERHAKALVIACNTARVVAVRRLRDSLLIPIVAMEPAIKPAAKLTQSKVILVLATTGTIHSQSVAQLCRMHGAGIRIILQACPGLSDQVERGEFLSGTTRQLLEKYVLPGVAEGADTIVLGCTHYAFLSNEIAAIAGPSVTIVEPSTAIARQLARVLPAATPCVNHSQVKTTYYTSGPLALMSSFLEFIDEPFDQVFSLPAGEADFLQAEDGPRRYCL
jgi:glutamate racemase